MPGVWLSGSVWSREYEGSNPSMQTIYPKSANTISKENMKNLIFEKYEDLVGFTFTDVISDGYEELIFHREDGKKFKFYHRQDCCELVSIEEVIGDLKDLIGEPLLIAESASCDDEENSESGTWTFYKFATRKGYVDVRWYGSSNGYYSEYVSFAEID